MRGGKKKVAKRLFDHEESRFDDLQLLAPCRAAVRGASVVCFFFLSPPLLRRAPVAFGLSSKEDAIFVCLVEKQNEQIVKKKKCRRRWGRKKKQTWPSCRFEEEKKKKVFVFIFFGGDPCGKERESLSLAGVCVT